MLQVACLTVGPLAENCWVVSDTVAHEAVIVDPGDEAPRIVAAVAATGCAVTAIWLTHAHFDHLGAVAALEREWSVPVRMHPADQPLYERAAESAARWGFMLESPAVATAPLAEGDTVNVGDHAFTVWHVPGHAPGHVAFIGAGYCISGDVLFAGSIGRTDLPLCDPHAMQQSLRRLATLPEATQVLPGHGPSTTIAQERIGNPFLRGLARPVGVS